MEVSTTVRWEADTAIGGGSRGFTPSPEHGLRNIFAPSGEHRRRVISLDEGQKLQGKRLAFELAKKIRADRQNLLSKLGKSQEETTAP